MASADVNAAVAAVQAEPNPIIQVDLARFLVETRPEVGSQVCHVLPQREAELCNTLVQRPHLYEDAQQLSPNQPNVGTLAAGGGPSALLPLASAEACAATAEWACGEAGDSHLCRINAGRASVGMGDGHGLEHCACISDDTWRAECAFVVADAMGNNQESSQNTATTLEAIKACGYAGPLFKRCMSHTLPRVSNAHGSPPELAAFLATAKPTFASFGPGLGEELELHVWSAYFMLGGGSRQALGPVSEYPPAAIPLVRLEVAKRLWVQMWRAGERPDLATLSEAVHRHASGIDDASALAPAPNFVAEGPASWERLAGPNERALRVAPIGLLSHRAWVDDPQIDATVATVEMLAAYGDADSMKMLAEGLQHPAPVVQWTTIRLLGWRQQLQQHNVQGGNQGHPLIKERLGFEQNRQHTHAIGG